MPAKPAAGPSRLAETLEAYRVDDLKGLGKYLVTHLPARKADLVALIQERMTDPQSLRQLWAKLDRMQQLAVAEALYAHEGRFDRARFRAKYGAEPDWGAKSTFGQVTTPSALGLFIHNDTIPPDLAAPLKAFVPRPAAASIKTAEAPVAVVAQTRYDYERRKKREIEISVTVVETERAAQHDRHSVLRLIDGGTIRVSETTRQISSAGANAMAEVLQGGDFYPLAEKTDPYLRTEPGPIKAFAWPLIVQSAGLAELAGSKLQLTAAGKKALSSAPHEVIRKAWERWLKSALLDEFNRIHAIKGQTSKGKRVLTAPAGRRTAIADALAECPTGCWIETSEFSRYMQAAGHTFTVARDLWHLYIGAANYGSLGYAGFGDWHIVQERYLLAFLFEYVATLGLIDVAYIPPSGARPNYRDLWGADDLDWLSRYDGLLQFRINGLGAWCLGLTHAYVPAPQEVQAILQVLPNGDIVVSASTPPGDLLVLGRFAEQVSDYVWRFQPVRLLEALEQGQALADVGAFLEARASGPLPQNIAATFRELAERVAQLTDRGPARLVEVQEPALALLIANDSRLRSLCMLAGERYLVIPAEGEKAFRRALHELGYALIQPRT